MRAQRLASQQREPVTLFTEVDITMLLEAAASAPTVRSVRHPIRRVAVLAPRRAHHYARGVPRQQGPPVIFISPKPPPLDPTSISTCSQELLRPHARPRLRPFSPPSALTRTAPHAHRAASGFQPTQPSRPRGHAGERESCPACIHRLPYAPSPSPLSAHIATWRLAVLAHRPRPADAISLSCEPSSCSHHLANRAGLDAT